MDYSCHQCHATVQEGTAFCPHCNAPQIRVAVAETVPSFPTIEGEVSPPVSFFGSAPVSRIEWAQAFPATALAGFIAAILTIIPVATFGLGMLVGGVLSVILYRRRKFRADIAPGMGARLGIVAGMLGFAMLMVPLALGAAIFHLGDEIRARTIVIVEQAAARSSDPQMQHAVEMVKTPEGSALFLGLTLILTFVAFVIFSGLGGAVGAALLRRKQRL
ncbi:MAG TPA: zinc ribbon domain-containing protein [Terriglobales bacterium]|nr:zinc ribbon domain-containing protein [Terriglobales bacterium]